MQRGRGLAALALLGAVAVGTCVYPTEHDASVHVSITSIRILFRGEDTIATARAWRMLGPADSQPIPNVAFVWSSSDPGVATVDNAGHIVGVTSGTTIIRAAAANFDAEALAAADTLRVSAPIEVDSIRPDTPIRYGEMMTIYGVGVDSIFSASLAGAQLIPNLFADSTFAGGTARRRYWVPPPARTDSVFIIGVYNGSGIFGYVRTDTVRVVLHDLYEDQPAPATIDLDGPRPFPGTALDAVLFTNPALAFEVLPRDSAFGIDWYRLQQGTSRDLTVIITAPEVRGTFAGFVSDAFDGAAPWTVGPGSHNCRGKKFSPKEAVGDSTIVALAGVSIGSLDVIALYTQQGRYGLTAVDGYLTSNRGDPRIVKDTHEEDDYCDAVGAQVTKMLAVPYRDTLTIDNPHDVDWIRFNVPGSLVTSVQLHTNALPAVVGQDSSDIDLYVLHEPSPGAQLDSIAGVASPGSVNNTTLLLAPGNYYAVVVDFAGVPTPYAICIVAGLGSCP